MNTQVLSELAREKRKQYYKEWRKKPENKLKAKQYLQRYWEKKANEEKVS